MGNTAESLTPSVPSFGDDVLFDNAALPVSKSNPSAKTVDVLNVVPAPPPPPPATMICLPKFTSKTAEAAPPPAPVSVPIPPDA